LVVLCLSIIAQNDDENEFTDLNHEDLIKWGDDNKDKVLTNEKYLDEITKRFRGGDNIFERKLASNQNLQKSWLKAYGIDISKISEEMAKIFGKVTVQFDGPDNMVLITRLDSTFNDLTSGIHINLLERNFDLDQNSNFYFESDNIITKEGIILTPEKSDSGLLIDRISPSDEGSLIYEGFILDINGMKNPPHNDILKLTVKRGGIKYKGSEYLIGSYDDKENSIDFIFDSEGNLKIKGDFYFDSFSVSGEIIQDNLGKSILQKDSKLFVKSDKDLFPLLELNKGNIRLVGYNQEIPSEGSYLSYDGIDNKLFLEGVGKGEGISLDLLREVDLDIRDIEGSLSVSYRDSNAEYIVDPKDLEAIFDGSYKLKHKKYTLNFAEGSLVSGEGGINEALSGAMIKFHGKIGENVGFYKILPTKEGLTYSACGGDRCRDVGFAREKMFLRLSKVFDFGAIPEENPGAELKKDDLQFYNLDTIKEAYVLETDGGRIFEVYRIRDGETIIVDTNPSFYSEGPSENNKEVKVYYKNPDFNPREYSELEGITPFREKYIGRTKSHTILGSVLDRVIEKEAVAAPLGIIPEGAETLSPLVDQSLLKKLKRKTVLQEAGDIYFKDKNGDFDDRWNTIRFDINEEVYEAIDPLGKITGTYSLSELNAAVKNSEAVVVPYTYKIDLTKRSNLNVYDSRNNILFKIQEMDSGEFMIFNADGDSVFRRGNNYGTQKAAIEALESKSSYYFLDPFNKPGVPILFDPDGRFREGGA
jgi:hypothetical protein